MGKSDQDLDASMDAHFGRARDGGHVAAGPAGGLNPAGPDPAVEDERAAAILRAAPAAGPGDSTLDALSAPPGLLSEPGEPRSTPETSRAEGATSKNGSAMSDETPKPPSSRRPSLKDLAVSVKNRPSQSGRDSQPPVSQGPGSKGSPPSLKDTLVALDGKTPPPPPSSYDAPHSPRGPISAPPSSLGGGPASAPPASGPSSGPRASSPGPLSTPASGPGSARPLALAPTPPNSNPNSVPSTKPSAGVHKSSAKQGSGIGLGVGIAVVGLAAAAAFAFWSKSQPPAPPTAVAAEEKHEVEEVAKTKDDGATTAVKQDEPEAKPDGVIDINQLADAAGTAAPAGGPGASGPLPGGAPASSAVASKDPTKPAGPGEELDEAIKNRAGGGNGTAEDAEPAAGDGARKNVADVPATGAVTSAINAVKGSAKGCVAGAEEPSTATITFGSSGAVQSVTVGGWAQGKSAAGCIKAALQAARVPPFAKPTYSTSVTIRP